MLRLRCWTLLLQAALTLYPTLLPAAEPNQRITVGGLGYGQFSFSIRATSSGIADKLKTNLLWSGLYRYTADSANSDIRIELEYIPNRKIAAFIDSRWGRRYFAYEKSALDGEALEPQKAIEQIALHLTGEPNHMGNAIVYVEKGDFPGYRIVLTDPFGERRKVLVEDGNLNILPRWNADATSILFTSLSKSGSRIKQYRFADSRTETFLSGKSKFSGGTWGKNGEIILTISKGGNSDLYRIDQRGAILERLTSRTSTESNPRWSPDGKRLVFISNRSGSIQIYQRDLETGEVNRMTYEGGANVEPNWSGNGAYIVFAGMRNGRFQIFFMDREGEYVRQITDGPHSSEQPVWSPRGRQILFVSKRHYHSKLYIVNADGSHKRRVTRSDSGINEFNPDWTENFDWASYYNRQPTSTHRHE